MDDRLRVHSLIRRAIQSIRRWQLRRRFFYPGFGQVKNGTGEHGQSPRGNVLIAYTPWMIKRIYRDCRQNACWNEQVFSQAMCTHEPEFRMHSNYWESAELVRQCIARGFQVDFIAENHGSLVESISEYDLILDAGANLSAWLSNHHKPDCKTVFYSTTGFWQFANAAELERQAWLAARRGFVANPVRQLPPSDNAKRADLITSFGNSTVRERFCEHANKIHPLQVSVVADDVAPLSRDWTSARKHVVFFGSSGWVHRGLDLVVEVFANMPDCTLSIVGPYANDNAPDFWECYRTELSTAKNIRVLGFMDPLGDTFHALMQSAGTVLYPTASEGCSSSVLQCLHYGLIPIITPYAGLAENNAFAMLNGNTDKALMASIEAHVREIASASPETLQARSDACRTFARSHHTRQAYSESLSKFLDVVLPE